MAGCVATGETIEKAKRNITRAIGMHPELMRQSRESIPRPRRRIEFAIDENAPDEMCTWVEVKTAEAVA
jgi:predicted RNase H-like HicB family nuclease